MSKPKSGKAVIRAMIELLSKRGAWTQGALALDRNGRDVDVYDDEASCFCIEGALWRVADVPRARYKAWRHIALLCDGAPTTWNDAPGRTKRQVLAMLRKAAA